MLRWAIVILPTTRYTPFFMARPCINTDKPPDREVKRKLKLSLYYTEFTKTARIREQHRMNRKYRLDREDNAEVPVNIAPKSITWFVAE